MMIHWWLLNGVGFNGKKEGRKRRITSLKLAIQLETVYIVYIGSLTIGLALGK